MRKTVTPPYVLAVDDDRIALRIIEAALKPVGWTVVTAGDLASAKARLEEPGGERFTCALIDYQLPDGNGTDLLRWLHERESPIAAVMVTASDEQDLVKQTMVEGACNFLQKPVSVEELRQAVVAASSTSGGRRRLTEVRDQVENAAHTQERLLDRMLRTDAFVEYKFCPKHQCGGDFLVHHRFPSGDEIFVVSDVSGHDIGATVQSSFFHGWMSGFLKEGGDMDAAIRAYNRRLVDMNGLGGSIAVTALRVEPKAGCLTAWNCGGPPPMYVDWRGRTQGMTARTSSPLGWFDPIDPPTTRMGIPPGPVWIWTDGLDSLADSERVSSLAVAYALLASPDGAPPPWLQQATDDVLVARIWPGAPPDFVPPPYFHPLIVEEHCPASAAEIDSIQGLWKRSLRLALPDLPRETVHDILLGSREALLNGLNHGCCGEETASFQLLYNPAEGLLRVRVDDPGAGHAFDWRMIMEQEEPTGAHCGLVMIHATSSRVSFSRNGAELTIDYTLSEDLNIIRQGGSQ